MHCHRNCSAIEAAGTAASSSIPADFSTDRRVAVLLVDDDALVLMGTAAMLEDLGHLVTTASSGAEALLLLDGGCTVDLVLTDHAMPGMTGVELAHKLRQRRPDLPVILATGYADLPRGQTEDLDLPRLSKPFLQEDLARVIAGLWSGGERAAAQRLGESRSVRRAGGVERSL